MNSLGKAKQALGLVAFGLSFAGWVAFSRWEGRSGGGTDLGMACVSSLAGEQSWSKR